MNTVFGQSSEPFPFQGMSSYPYAPGEQFPETDKTRDYLHRYQTRRQQPSQFWRYVCEHAAGG